MTNLESTTYAQLKDAEFDWHDALAPNHRLKPEMWNHLYNLSTRWVSCACGNQCSVIPRMGELSENPGRPLDNRLFELGNQFCSAVDAKRKSRARQILRAIEVRSRQILTEMGLLPPTT